MILNALDEILFWSEIDVLKDFMTELMKKHYPDNPIMFYKEKSDFLLKRIPTKTEFANRLNQYALYGKPVWVSGKNGLNDDIDKASLVKAIDINSTVENGKAKADKAIKIYDKNIEFWNYYAKNILHKKENCILELTIGAGLGTTIVMKNMKPCDCYIGVDIDFACAKNADAIAKYLNVRGLGLTVSLWNLPFEDNMFSCVCCNAGLEECREIDTILKESCRVLEPNGRLILHTIQSHKSTWLPYFKGYGFSKEEGLDWLKKVRLFSNEKQI